MREAPRSLAGAARSNSADTALSPAGSFGMPERTVEVYVSASPGPLGIDDPPPPPLRIEIGGRKRINSRSPSPMIAPMM